LTGYEIKEDDPRRGEGEKGRRGGRGWGLDE
jgi:hypothetical protein